MSSATTIFAPATAAGRSGIAVIRISGTKSAAALHRLGVRDLPPPRQAQLADLRHPQSRELIDRALILWFPAPASFTGEDVAELHIHGSHAILQELLTLLSSFDDMRLAEPGEFSRRAFVNNKMDLTAAEGLADLINAETTAQKRQALRALQGEMGEFYGNLRNKLLHLQALLEAYIDFPDEDIPDDLHHDMEKQRLSLLNDIETQLDDNHVGERICEGIRVVIAGAVNSGKSTLLNRLAGKDAAITSKEAGTTRDVIEVRMDIGGVAVTLADTAGLRETSGDIETQGIIRSWQQIRQADIILLVSDPYTDFIPDTERILKHSGEAGKAENVEDTGYADNQAEKIIVFNKSDIAPLPVAAEEWLRRIFSSSDSGSKPAGWVHISARKGQGIAELIELLRSQVEKLTTAQTPPMITHIRYRRALEAAKTHLQEFAREKEIVLQCEHLRRAATEIGKITGHISVDEILGEIFSRFCIGK